MWLLDEQKVVISKDVVFHEVCLFIDLEKGDNSLWETEVTNFKKKVTFRSNLEKVFSEKNKTGESSTSGGGIN